MTDVFLCATDDGATLTVQDQESPCSDGDLVGCLFFFIKSDGEPYARESVFLSIEQEEVLLERLWERKTSRPKCP